MDQNPPTQTPPPVQDDDQLDQADQAKFDALVKRAEELSEKVKKTRHEADSEMAEVERQVTDTEAQVKEATTKLNAANQSASNELDKLIIEDAQDPEE